MRRCKNESYEAGQHALPDSRHDKESRKRHLQTLRIESDMFSHDG